MTYTIHVIGEARPEAKRQRFFRNKAGQTVVGPRTDEPDRADWKGYVRAEALRVCDEPIAGPVALDITVYRPRPASYPNRPTKGNPWPWHWWKKPDVDNLQKPICDALSKVAWLDDAQIVDSAVHKRFGDRWEVVVRVESVGGRLDITPGDRDAA